LTVVAGLLVAAASPWTERARRPAASRTLVEQPDGAVGYPQHPPGPPAPPVARPAALAARRARASVSPPHREVKPEAAVETPGAGGAAQRVQRVRWVRWVRWVRLQQAWAAPSAAEMLASRDVLLAEPLEREEGVEAVQAAAGSPVLERCRSSRVPAPGHRRARHRQRCSMRPA